MDPLQQHHKAARSQDHTHSTPSSRPGRARVLKALSSRVLRALPNATVSHLMRANVLSGLMQAWEVGPARLRSITRPPSTTSGPRSCILLGPRRPSSNAWRMSPPCCRGRCSWFESGSRVLISRQSLACTFSESPPRTTTQTSVSELLAWSRSYSSCASQRKPHHHCLRALAAVAESHSISPGALRMAQAAAHRHLSLRRGQLKSRS